MPTFNPISQWEEEKPFEDTFVLKFEEYPKLYSTANKLYEKCQAAIANGETPDRLFPKPVEQLSSKGLALMSYLYAQKDNNPAQPLIAVGENGLTHIVSLVDSAPIGTGVPILYQPSDRVHKTAFWLEKSDTGLIMINMDSIKKDQGEVCTIALSAAKSKLYYYSEVGDIQRQRDGYQCGVFSMKDLRQILQDKRFCQTIQNKSGQISNQTDLFVGFYETPTAYMKSVQNKQNVHADLIARYPTDIVSKRNDTLKSSYQKHEPYGGYIPHFSNKMTNAVIAFVKNHAHEQETVKQAVELYDAESMTPNRLQAIYGPKGDPTLIALLSGIANGDESAARQFVAGYPINRPLYQDYTALQIAARNGHTHLVRYFLNEKADINVINPISGFSTLQVAIQYQQSETVSLLLAQDNIDTNHVDHMGSTALHDAAKHSMGNSIDMLIQKGFKINTKDNEGFEAIHYACAKGDPQTIHSLIKNGASLLALTHNQQPSLHILASHGHYALIKELYTTKSELNKQDTVGNTALHYAASLEKKDAVDVLLSLKADVNIANNDGNTPLHLAVLTYNRDIIKIILEQGANIYQKNNEGKTPLDIAPASWIQKCLMESEENRPKTIAITKLNTLRSIEDKIEKNPTHEDKPFTVPLHEEKHQHNVLNEEKPQNKTANEENPYKSAKVPVKIKRPSELMTDKIKRFENPSSKPVLPTGKKRSP